MYQSNAQETAKIPSQWRRQKILNSRMNRLNIQPPKRYEFSEQACGVKKKKNKHQFLFSKTVPQRKCPALAKSKGNTHTHTKGRNVSFAESRALWQRFPEKEDSQWGNNRHGWAIRQGEPLIFHKQVAASPESPADPIVETSLRYYTFKNLVKHKDSERTTLMKPQMIIKTRPNNQCVYVYESEGE